MEQVPEYTTRELTKDEAEALNKDMMDLMEKHGAEMSVISHIQLLKREELIKSEYGTADGETPKAL